MNPRPEFMERGQGGSRNPTRNNSPFKGCDANRCHLSLSRQFVYFMFSCLLACYNNILTIWNSVVNYVDI